MHSVIGNNFVSGGEKMFWRKQSALAAKPEVRRNARLDSATPFIGFSLCDLLFAETGVRAGV
jgi:hypothetical protein